MNSEGWFADRRVSVRLPDRAARQVPKLRVRRLAASDSAVQPVHVTHPSPGHLIVVFVISPRGRGPAWRALLTGGVILMTLLVVSGGTPALAVTASAADEVAVDPNPSASPEPSPSAPPDPAEPTAPATPDPTPAPSPPPVTPGEDTPAVPTPPVSTPAPPVSSSWPTLLDPPPAEPAAFGRVYPTNPWIYNGLPGTRYGDVRERDDRSVLRRHMGIDAQGGVRQPIYAVSNGTVIGGTWGTTKRDGHGYGNQVLLSHADGFTTRYAHFADPPLVRPGETVVMGQLIGFMGGSQRGNLTAVDRHLHFEVTKGGRIIDPLPFLTGASTTTAALVPTASASEDADTSDTLLYEITPAGDGSYVSASTGLTVNANAFSAVAMRGISAEVLASENGRLMRLAPADGVWTKTDTGIALDASSLSAVDTGRGAIEVLAVEDGKLFHIVRGASGWAKTWTGHDFSGTVSAVVLPGGRLHAILEQAGYLYHLSPAVDGLWNITDTGIRVDGSVDAVYVGGGAPEAVTVIGGEAHRVIWDGLAWQTQATGLPASGSLAAVYQSGGWPSAFTADEAISLLRVSDGLWTRTTYGMDAPGRLDAVIIGGTGAVLYSIG